MTNQATKASPEVQLEHFETLTGRLRAELRKVIVGQDPVIESALVCLLAGGHLLLSGAPGLGKTALVRSLAQAVDLTLSRIQFTPDLMPADILGTQVLREDGEFRFSRGPVFANLLLADEINRATPKTQSALLEAMQERAVTVAQQTHSLPTPFMVMATQNPIDMEGTYPLPEAQLDRFMLKLEVPFPPRQALRDILERGPADATGTIEPVLSRDDILALQQTAREVAVAPHVIDYVVALIEATHPEREGALRPIARFVRFGVSPRGGQALLAAAKVMALFAGRPHVAQADVDRALLPAFRHRLLLTFEGEAEAVESDDLLNEILAHHAGADGNGRR